MKGKKKILLAVALVLVMAVGITSIVVIRNRNKTVVKVFPVSMLNSSDWFDTDTSLTGTLTSDYIQEVHIDGGQKVKKVYVKKGDKVKKGDILLKYNVSEKELDLKLQKLQIQSSKMEIAEMEKELKKLFKYGVHEFYTYPDEGDKSKLVDQVGASNIVQMAKTN